MEVELTSMRKESAIEGQGARSEPIAARTKLSMNYAKNFRSCVAMEVGRPIRLFRNVPPLIKDCKVGKRDARRLRASSEDGVDRRVAVIFQEIAVGDKRAEVIFVRNIAATCISIKVRQVEDELTHFPCQATTSNGVCSCLEMRSWPPSL